MANLVKDFWTYTYKNKNYFGIVEVVKGEDLSQNRHEKKYETHIERAMEYTMEKQVLSHMSIQSYCTWLKDRSGREESEQKYYPFVLEFESNDINKYSDVVYQVAGYVKYLITELNIHKDDILIMINNSKSLYVYVNPKAFSLKPEKSLHKIYLEMYREIKADLGLKYVDESIVTSSYKLMKAPNSFYKDGYFVWITIEELMKLLTGVKTKEELTKKRRSLNKEVPSQLSLKAARLYNAAAKRVKYGYKSNTNNSGDRETSERKCTQYLLQHMIEQGYRNYGLVSVAIYLKSLGYTKEEVKRNLLELAESWNHDESSKKIDSKINTIFRRNYKFSCTYAKTIYADLGIENMCSKCPHNCKKASGIKDAVSIDANIVNELWSNNASTRHYLLYLKLVNKGLLNKNFNPEEEQINDRTLRELCSACALSRTKKDGQVYISYNQSKKQYFISKGFIEESAEQLGDYVKHYLKMFVKGYKALEKYILIRMSKETLMKELGYTDISSLYKMIKKFKDMGLLKEHASTSMYTLYYQSYKVVSIKDITNDDKEVYVQEQLSVVGEQISLKGIEKYNDIQQSNIVFKWENKPKKSKVARGSPIRSG